MHIEKIKISATGEQLAADSSDHVAVLLPQFRLMFTRRPVNTEERSQADLVKACAELTLAGFSDWDMPEIDELQLVVDRSRFEPAFDNDYFSDIPNDWIWTKTGTAWNRDAAGVSPGAWLVYAYLGGVDGLHRDYTGFALAVRRVGQ
jgi:hypothetical protein